MSDADHVRVFTRSYC